MHSQAPKIELEERFQLFLDSARDYALFFMQPDGRICEWSRGAETMLGYSEAEALNLVGDVIFTEEDRSRGVPEKEKSTAVAEGEANDERWHVRKDGRQFFAIGRMVALKDSSGKLRGFAKILRDATPNKKLQDVLHATEGQLRAIFSQAPWGIVLTDLHSRIQQVNAAFTKMTGFSTEDLAGKNLLTVPVASDREKTQQKLEELFTKKKDTVAFEKRINRADGSCLWVHNSITVLRDAEGRPFSILDLNQDISALKLSEEELAKRVDERTAALREKTAQMESFVYTVAHDLRAPLRAMSGYAGVLKEDHATTISLDAGEYLQKIESAAERLDQLIRDLLDYTRVQQVAFAREEVDLTSVTSTAIKQVSAEHDVANMKVRLDAPLGTLQSDRVAIEHVIVNLLSNAVKFRRPGIPLEIHVFSEKKPGSIRLWVEDNGIGIDPKYRDRAFQMFERLHPQLNIPGTGVGLAIVSTAIERLGGTRGVEQNSPEGSRFWIELPTP